MTAFAPGMRVVLAEGDWPVERIAGSYGKVTRVDEVNGDGNVYVCVDITGHIDGQPPMNFEAMDWTWFYSEELTVVD